MAGMTSSVSASGNRAALFYHEMIPHHQNAVNMAKALLKTGKLVCDDLTDEESDQADDCTMEVLLRSIINVQNHEIQIMESLLKSGDCVVRSSEGGATVPAETPPEIAEPTKTIYEL